MTGKEFQDLRVKSGFSALQWGRALGYSGSDNAVNVEGYRYEGGQREIPTWIARLAYMYGHQGVPKIFRG